MSFFSRIAEDRIQTAMQEGKFDNLPGKGQPLHLEDNPFEQPEQRAAHSLLKKNGFRLPWMDRRAEIEAERLQIRRRLRTSYSAGRGALPAHTLQQFEQEIDGLNRQIMEYNLSVPSALFQMPPLDRQREQALALDSA